MVLRCELSTASGTRSPYLGANGSSECSSNALSISASSIKLNDQQGSNDRQGGH